MRVSDVFKVVIWAITLPFWLLFLVYAVFGRPLAAVWRRARRHLRAKPFDPLIWNHADCKQREARYWMVDDVIRKLMGKSREEVYELLGTPDCGHHGYTFYGDPHYLQGGRYEFRFHGYYLKRAWPIGDYELLISLNAEAKVEWAKVIYKLRGP
jgi:hypothetical protein